MTLYAHDGQPLKPSRPEPRVTAKFTTLDVGHVLDELRTLALVCGVRAEITNIVDASDEDDNPDELEVDVYGKQIDVERYMDAVKRWSGAGEAGCPKCGYGPYDSGTGKCARCAPQESNVPGREEWGRAFGSEG